MKVTSILCGLAIVAITTVTACKKDSFLDRKTETLTEEKVFADSALTIGLINDMYRYTGQDIVVSRYDGGSIGAGISTPVNNDDACLEDQTTLSTSYWSDPQSSVMGGTYSASNYAFNNYWTQYYRKIRQASLFMQKAVNSPISATRKARLMAEAKYLRAFFYVSLIRFYGGVQIMPNEPLEATDPLISQRNTYKECVDYAVAELDAAAAGLPAALTQDPSEYGHATKGAAMALKARLLLTAASPLFNGKSFSSDGTILPYITYSATYDPTLWVKAANALKAVIDLPDYALVEDNITRPGNGFWKMFISGRKNSEYIIPFIVPNNAKIIEAYRFPRSRGGYGGYSNPSENAVEYFGMKNGKDIRNPSSGYNTSQPFANRDPRFDYSVIYNQAPIWKSGSGTTLVPIDIYFNKATNALTADGIQAYYTKTGYYSRKMANDITGTSVSIDRALPVLRFAEIIMGYAEALNEMQQSEQAVTWLIKIRNRAGIEAGPDNRYGIAPGISQDDLRKLIQKESVAEFFQEGHFWYDTRRWRIAEITESKNIMGNYITKELDGTFTYKNIVALSVNWQNRAYLAPIPQAEINKAATLLQNPGW